MKKETRTWIRELAFFSSLGFSVSLSIFIGLGIGVYLDRRFGTSPWLMLVFLGLGIAAGYRNIGLAIGKEKKPQTVTRSSEKSSTVNIQQRLLTFVTRSNWVLLVSVSLLGLLATSPPFARGVIFGGLIVTINFHLLAKTLKKALRPQQLASPNVILVKYYIRFIISGVIIFFLIRQQVVNPIGLFIGLSVVVVSITLATMVELKKLIFKEAV
jgi:hypothetical protein